MNPVLVLFCSLQIIFVPMFIKSGWPKSKKSTLFIKMVCSTIFIGFALYNILNSDAGFESTYSRLVFTGLALGWVGDVFMTFDPFLVNKSKTINTAVGIVGGVSFLAGHIFFITAFLKATKSVGAEIGKEFFIIFAVTLAVILLAKVLLKLKLGKLTAPVAVYALMIDIMFSLGLNLGLSYGSTAALISLGAGTLLFVVSDFSLGLKIFDGERFNTLKIRTVYITTYYIAQMLIAYSLSVIK